MFRKLLGTKQRGTAAWNLKMLQIVQRACYMSGRINLTHITETGPSE
jgi:protein-disulfide isomerase-like protein with CxxC motif